MRMSLVVEADWEDPDDKKNMSRDSLELNLKLLAKRANEDYAHRRGQPNSSNIFHELYTMDITPRSLARERDNNQLQHIPAAEVKPTPTEDE